MNASDWRRHRFTNWLQSVLLLGGMGALLALLGWLFGGFEAMLWILILGTLLLLTAPRISPHVILAMYGARQLISAEAPQLFALVDELCARAHITYRPTLHYVPTRMMNAFTVGSRADSALAVTDGLLRSLTGREIAGVLAHEVSHIRNNDTWIMGLADLVSRLTSALSLSGQVLLMINLPLVFLTSSGFPWLGILLLIFSPALSTLLQLALSRTREFDADIDAIRLTGDPVGLASALEKLEYQQQGLWSRLFRPGKGEPQPSMLRTHPQTEERIRRLLSLAREAERAPVETPWESTPPFGLAPIARTPRRHWTGLWH